MSLATWKSIIQGAMSPARSSASRRKPEARSASRMQTALIPLKPTAAKADGSDSNNNVVRGR
jgi:hypothetical protein